ncbi:FapA family protein [Halobacillus rhizosphaerae]|uniref:FapA family protein n=1 Tax=Halobacillus rhizosphaerae TaxID=3064889 RepID=UPI00398A73E8
MFKVPGDLNLKTGNLDFVGSIEINGNVPSGFHLKADGDIKILGMVEGAEIIAGGSVYVGEGVSGLGKAVIQAGLDIRVGYINQAAIEAGQNLFVENSILHSHCVAKDSIYCQKGNIIGGTLSAGVRIEAKDIGNRMSTPTGLYLGVNKKVEEKVKKFTQLKNQKLEEKSKLHKLGEMLINKINQGENRIKDKITLLRQKNSLSSVEEEIEDLTSTLSAMDAVMGEVQGASVEVSGTLFANTNLGFGRYQYKVMETKQKVIAILEEGEIVIHQKP